MKRLPPHQPKFEDDRRARFHLDPRVAQARKASERSALERRKTSTRQTEDLPGSLDPLRGGSKASSALQMFSPRIGDSPHLNETSPSRNSVADAATSLMPASGALSGSELGAAIAMPILLGFAIMGLMILFTCRHRNKRASRNRTDKRLSYEARSQAQDDIEKGTYSQFDATPRRQTRLTAFASLGFRIFTRSNQASGKSPASPSPASALLQSPQVALRTPKQSFQRQSSLRRAGFTHLASPDHAIASYQESQKTPKSSTRAPRTPGSGFAAGSPIALPSQVILNDDRYISSSPRESRVWRATIDPSSPGLQALTNGIMQSPDQGEYRGGPIMFSPRALVSPSPRTPSVASVGTLERIEEENERREPIPSMPKRSVSFVRVALWPARHKY